MRIEIDVSEWITDRKSLPATNNNYMPVVREKYIKNGRFPKKAHYASMIMSEEAKAWKQFLTLEIKRQADYDKKWINKSAPLHVDLTFNVPVFNQNNTIKKWDIDGPIKFILDAIAEAIDIDDKQIMSLEVEKNHEDKEYANIIIEVRRIV